MVKSTNSFPAYLFGEGTNYESYKFFSAKYIINNGKKMWRFRAWAPNAKSLSVVGDFNGWDRSKNPMLLIDEGGGIWEGFVRSLKKYDNYKFSIEDSSGKIRLKADPYALHAETAPGTASKIYDIKGYEWQDSAFLEHRKRNNPYASPMNIYEVHLGSWKKYEDGNYLSYLDYAKTLVPYCVEMGYTHIELLPITEFPYDGSWGYQVTGLYSPTSRFGTPADFMSFIDECHKAGLYVIMDFVLSHFPKDEFGLYEFDGTCQYEYSDPLKQEHKSWGTRIYDYAKPQVRSFLISAVNFWLEYYHIDGIRLDAVASMLYLDYDRKEGEWRRNNLGGNHNLEAIAFLQQLNTEILKRHPDCIMIAEESTAFPMVTMPPTVGGLGFNFKWNMGWMNDVLDYERIDPFFRKGAHDKLTFSITYAFSENYILPFSHDEVVHGKASMISKMAGNYEEKFSALKALYTYQMTHPGKKLNFMGNEFGQFIEWDYKKSLEWFLLDYSSHKKLQTYVKALNKFYMKTPALFELDNVYDGFEWVVVDDRIQNIIVYRRIDKKGNSVICVINFSRIKRENYEIGVEHGGAYEELLNSQGIEYGGSVKPGIRYTAIKKPNHNKKFSIRMTIEGNSAMIIKKIKNVKERNNAKNE